MDRIQSRAILPVIVVSQFLCTSLWFAGNAIIGELVSNLSLPADILANLTSAIQFGFISGTLFFAVFTIADRFSPSKVFFVSALIAGLFNLGIALGTPTATEVLLFRFLTGFFLAGIYPVGMKIAADHFGANLGKSLGFLLGALACGTAAPHLLKDVALNFSWKYVLYATSSLSLLGGLLMVLLVPDGPFRVKGQGFKLTAFTKGFANPKFRSAAFGYFGHMWELYSFWAFLPVILSAYQLHGDETPLNTSLFSFLIIATGGLSCIGSGLLVRKLKPKKIATGALFLSGCCCLASPFMLSSNNLFLFLGFLFFWGSFVVADSPMFSTIVAQNAPSESKGSSLTIVNCLGFTITIVSIQTLQYFSGRMDPMYLYLLLAPGPILGLAALLRKEA